MMQAEVQRLYDAALVAYLNTTAAYLNGLCTQRDYILMRDAWRMAQHVDRIVNERFSGLRIDNVAPLGPRRVAKRQDPAREQNPSNPVA